MIFLIYPIQVISKEESKARMQNIELTDEGTKSDEAMQNVLQAPQFI